MKRITQGIAASLAAWTGLAAALPAAAQAQSPPYYGPMHDWMWGPFGGFWMMPLFFLVVMIVLIVCAARMFSPRRAGEAGPPRGLGGLELLDARYARGEIGRDEYLQKKRDLTGAGAVG